MSVVRRQSLRDILLLQDRMNRVLEDSLRDMSGNVEYGDWIPHVDIFEDDNSINLKAELPGMRREDIILDVRGGMLSISGNKPVGHEDRIENYHIVERQYGSFCRTFSLTNTIDVEKITATYENGVLEVILPKMAPEITRQIEISAN